jgi:hypothetical protein
MFYLFESLGEKSNYTCFGLLFHFAIFPKKEFNIKKIWTMCGLIFELDVWDMEDVPWLFFSAASIKCIKAKYGKK